MNMHISGRPTFHLRQLLPKKEGRSNVFPLNQKRCYYFFSSRYALAAAIGALGLAPGDKILVPSYNCGVEIDPISHFGIEPVFYKINKDLLVDFDDLHSKISSRVKAILVTHFLGFPQPVDQIKKICVERNLFLIEDCAHAFLSSYQGKPLGSFGDTAFFSLYKTLPVPNGGALILNRKDLNYSKNSRPPNIFSTILHIALLLKLRTGNSNHSFKENTFRILNNGIYFAAERLKLLLIIFRKICNPKGLYLARPDSYLFIEDLRSWGISSLSKNIINKAEFKKIKSIRRRNFEYLLNHFLRDERCELPFRQLPSGVCPLFFPIILESPEKRQALYNLMKNSDVVTHPWWDRFHPEVPWDEFPDAVYLKQRLFGLPIHQDITLDHLDRIINEFEKTYQQIEG